MQWCTPLSLLIFALGFVGLRTAVAQGVPPGTQVADLLYSTPSCARGCVVRELMTAHCPLLNATALADCLCPNTALLAAISTCVQQACDHSDMIEALVPLGKLCFFYPQESRVNDLQTTCIAAIVVGVFITSLRCLCRYYKMRNLGPEDWTCVVATVLLVATAGNGFYLSKIGAGRHYWTEDPKNEVALWTTFWTAQLLYCWMQYFTKLSVLLLYIRVFGVTRWLRLACYGCIVALTTHTIPIFFIIFFQCQPLQAIWNKYIEGRCLDVSAVAYAGGALSIAWDVILIALPIPEILKLHVSARKRLTIAIIFALASAASVTTIIRLRYVVLFNATHDPSWDNIDVGIWSIVEQLCIIACGSLPVLRQWLVHIIPHIHIDWGTTMNTSIRARGQPSPHNEGVVEAVQPPRLPRPVHRWQTFGSLFLSINSTRNMQLDGTQPQPTSSCEELTDGLVLDRKEKMAIEESTGDIGLKPMASYN